MEDPKRRKRSFADRPDPSRAAESSDPEGWELLAGDEDDTRGGLAPNQELEEAMREAAEAVEAAQAGRAAGGPGGARNADLEAMKDRMLRLQADFENFRRRALKEKEEAYQYGYENLVKDLLPAVDNLDRAVEHASKNDGGDLDSFLQGVELVARDIGAVLAKHGVTRIESLGRPFDPAVHEAVAQVPDDKVVPGTVVQVFETGYRIHERLLRPARVIVSRASDDGDSGEPGTGTGNT